VATNDSQKTNTASFSALDALLLSVILNFTLQPLTEPDFGWHLRTGLDLLKHGGRLPTLDPYSHTMPDWPWVEHAWLTDLLLGVLYEGFGPGGSLAVIMFFGLVAAGAWLLAARVAHTSTPVRLLACSLSLWVALPFLGARTQLVTVCGIALLMWMLNRIREGASHMVWWLPPLFLLWANLHGGFTAGLFLLALVVGLPWLTSMLASVWPKLNERSDESPLPYGVRWRLAIAMCLSGLATFANPYGWRLHQEIIESLSDRFMIATLQEWHGLSLDTLAGKLFVYYLLALGLATARWYRRVEPVRWGLLLLFLALACLHFRNIPHFLSSVFLLLPN
jgi:hypothetical protein